MKEFFRGWRRKTSMATLILACVFAAGSVRSLYFIDKLAFPVGGGMSIRLFSFYGSICASQTVIEGGDSLYWHSYSWIQSDDARIKATFKFNSQSKLRWDAWFFGIDQIFRLDWAWAGFGTGQLSWPQPPLGMIYTGHNWRIVSAEEEQRQKLEDRIAEEEERRQKLEDRLAERMADLDGEIGNILSDWNYDPIGNTLALVVSLAERKSLMDSSIGESPGRFTDAEVAAGQTDSASIPTSVNPIPSKLPQRWLLIAIPYWSIVIPLILMSLWLLVSKPDKLAQKKISDPVPNKGATS